MLAEFEDSEDASEDMDLLDDAPDGGVFSALLRLYNIELIVLLELDEDADVWDEDSAYLELLAEEV
jgi:hypothetical protein